MIRVYNDSCKGKVIRKMGLWASGDKIGDNSGQWGFRETFTSLAEGGLSNREGVTSNGEKVYLVMERNGRPSNGGHTSGIRSI